MTQGTTGMATDSDTESENMQLQLRLTIRILQDRISQLENENHFLKGEFERMSCEQLLHTRDVSQETRERWGFYHKHKEHVATNLCKKHNISRDALSWTRIKKETDRMLESAKKM